MKVVMPVCAIEASRRRCGVMAMFLTLSGLVMQFVLRKL
jgi:hypothetical protein